MTGTVTSIPSPGTIGLFVDVDGPAHGFVDVRHLPDTPEQWPQVGTVIEFEIVQYAQHHDQVRLVPLDPAYRGGPRRPPEEAYLRELQRRLSGEKS